MASSLFTFSLITTFHTITFTRFLPVYFYSSRFIQFRYTWRSTFFLNHSFVRLVCCFSTVVPHFSAAALPSMIFLFSHFLSQSEEDWMTKEFFEGGTMPSHDLFLHFQEDLHLEDRWIVDGRNYGKTSLEWLERLDNNWPRVRPFLTIVHIIFLEIFRAIIATNLFLSCSLCLLGQLSSSLIRHLSDISFPGARHLRQDLRQRGRSQVGNQVAPLLSGCGQLLQLQQRARLDGLALSFLQD